MNPHDVLTFLATMATLTTLSLILKAFMPKIKREQEWRKADG